MAIQFGNQHIGLGKWRRGVYKIIFDNKWYYIGSSVDVHRRLCVWKHHLQKGEYTKNRSIGYILPHVSRIDFEILEFVRPDVEVKWYENKHIHRCFNDEYCLNIVDNAFDTIKDKKYLGYEPPKPKPEAPKKVNDWNKKVAQFDLNGRLIKVHNSIGEASRFSGISNSIIRKAFTNKGVRPKKYIFKAVAEDGSFIEPNILTQRILSEDDIRFIVSNYRTVGNTKLQKMFGIGDSYLRSIATGKCRRIDGLDYMEKMDEPKAKPVKILNESGEVVDIADSIHSAAKKIGAKMSCVQRALRKNSTASGYRFAFG